MSIQPVFRTRLAVTAAALFAAAVALACAPQFVPTPRPSVTQTPTGSATPSPTATSQPGAQPTAVRTISPEPTAVVARTPRPAFTPTPSPLVTPTRVATPTPTPGGLGGTFDPLATPEPGGAPDEPADETPTPVPPALPPVEEADFVVNSTGDQPDAQSGNGECATAAGTCTLRAAIEEAEATPGRNVIGFNIPGAGWQFIRPASPLPEIEFPLAIDGFSQPGTVPDSASPGNTARLQIILDGSLAPFGTSGLVLAGDSAVVRGLVIVQFLGAGVLIRGGDANQLQGNLIGLEVRGSLAQPNHTAGVLIDNGSANEIGGLEPWMGNVISANTGPGVLIKGLQAVGNRVVGNLIGTDAEGTRSRANGEGGVRLDLAPRNIIGGASAGARNVISGNSVAGVTIFGSQAFQNYVQGNYIGLDVSGRVAVANSGAGVAVIETAQNLIGGRAEGEGNVISGNNGPGVRMTGRSSVSNRVEGNLIGPTADGSSGAANFTHGVLIEEGAFRNNVGSVGGGNAIMFNRLAGIRDVTSGENAFLQNRIFGNGALGIDIGDDGVSPPEEWTQGNFRNPPTITRLRRGPTLLVEGFIQSRPNSQYRVEFFRSNPCDLSGTGEGAEYIGVTSVSTDPYGWGEFRDELPFEAQPDDDITATATDTRNTTSEFSRCADVPFAIE